MPPRPRKRRAPEDDDEPAPSQSRRHTQAVDPDDEDEADEAEQGSGSGSIAQLSKNLVRYAIACEYSRTPIKRQDITQKVLANHSRSFKPVFEAANAQLMDVFGMRMVELPNREKVTLRQKRAAASSDSQAKNSNVWVLQTILPDEYRALDFMGPGVKPQDEDALDAEGSYIGLYTTVISLILLSGGQLSEGKLDRYMRRLKIGDVTPLDTTERVLARMAKDGYIVKIKESSNGEEIVDYMVGPRGKMEVGKEGVANLVRTMYGETEEGLDQRLTRSLGLGGEEADAGEERDAGARDVGPAAPARNGGRRAGKQRRREWEDDGDE